MFDGGRHLERSSRSCAVTWHRFVKCRCRRSRNQMIDSHFRLLGWRNQKWRLTKDGMGKDIRNGGSFLRFEMNHSINQIEERNRSNTSVQLSKSQCHWLFVAYAWDVIDPERVNSIRCRKRIQTTKGKNIEWWCNRILNIGWAHPSFRESQSEPRDSIWIADGVTNSKVSHFHHRFQIATWIRDEHIWRFKISVDGFQQVKMTNAFCYLMNIEKKSSFVAGDCC